MKFVGDGLGKLRYLGGLCSHWLAQTCADIVNDFLQI